MAVTANPFRNGERTIGMEDGVPFPSTNAEKPLSLLSLCPAHSATPLAEMQELAREAGIARLSVKDECGRIGLGSFKALGAAYVIACEAEKALAGKPGGDWATALAGRSFVTASAGNHGLSVAAGARIFGACAVIYLSQTVPEAFAARLRDHGAEVRRTGADYEASMAAAAQAAHAEGMTLLSDSSWPGYTDLPWRLMAGYLVLAKEAADQLAEAPGLILLQAGVGGMAGALAAYFRSVWGDGPVITVVEPEAAPALKASIEAGRFQPAWGPVSNMGRLDCKEASLIALKGLARDADFFVTISDEAAASACPVAARHGIATTPSGIAGLAALLDPDIRAAIGANAGTHALVVISEGAEDADG